MRSHLRSVAKRKVSDFLLREDGMVGNRTAFSAAAFVSTTALAATLLVSTDAGADNPAGDHCPVHPEHCAPGEFCCRVYDGLVWDYDCLKHGAQCGDC
ncbi:MAG: hypothetical protein OXN17_05820 [Candidatus Poribacteria bacterium]|nr:hypothetical protein [Candidatus Poribacteria bacterium]